MPWKHPLSLSMVSVVLYRQRRCCQQNWAFSGDFDRVALVVVNELLDGIEPRTELPEDILVLSTLNLKV